VVAKIYKVVAKTYKRVFSLLMPKSLLYIWGIAVVAGLKAVVISY